MDKEFWLERWQTGQTQFNSPDPNACLTEFFQFPKGLVFVPLCGASIDMAWLVNQGHQVVGIELSDLALNQFIESQGLKGKWSLDPTSLKVFKDGDYQLYLGDYFLLTPKHLKDVNYVYDRAALVALPPALRLKYVEKLLGLLKPQSQILLVTCEYPAAEMAGPPFSVPETEVRTLYSQAKKISLLKKEKKELSPHLQEKGLKSFYYQLAFLIEV
jgi:thiopurine S-methyltransferase